MSEINTTAKGSVSWNAQIHADIRNMLMCQTKSLLYLLWVTYNVNVGKIRDDSKQQMIKDSSLSMFVHTRTGYITLAVCHLTIDEYEYTDTAVGARKPANSWVFLTDAKFCHSTVFARERWVNTNPGRFSVGFVFGFTVHNSRFRNIGILSRSSLILFATPDESLSFFHGKIHSR